LDHPTTHVDKLRYQAMSVFDCMPDTRILVFAV